LLKVVYQPRISAFFEGKNKTKQKKLRGRDYLKFDFYYSLRKTAYHKGPKYHSLMSSSTEMP